MSVSAPISGYSAPVKIELRLAQESLDVAVLGKGSFILRTPRRLSPQTAELIVTVAGIPSVYPISLLSAQASDAPDEVFFERLAKPATIIQEG
ncbi:MAG: hypothetical protein JNM18_12725 [Planctomycetaceae bacterium]|nr:hypothetical protein [Planctomycetaceae bacterium]